MKKYIILIALFIFSMDVWGQDKAIVVIDSFYVASLDTNASHMVLDTTYCLNHCPNCNSTNSTEYRVEGRGVITYFSHYCNNCGDIWIKRKRIRTERYFIDGIRRYIWRI